MTYSILQDINRSASIDSFDRNRICDMIKQSTLVGRGGAAFPVSKKWDAFINQKSDEKYLIVNTHEGEPYCYKDRFLIKSNIQAVLDGAMLTAYATGATKVIIATRKSDLESIEILKKHASKNVEIHIGSDRYAEGEETALIESIESGESYPRSRPPYPVISGLYRKPTLVHNVETLANISYIVRGGVEDFLSTGSECYKGTKLVSISGDICERTVLEVDFGTSVSVMLNKQLDIRTKDVIAIVPSFAHPIYDLTNLKIDYDSFKNAGSQIGTCSLSVFTSYESLCKHLRESLSFLIRESCTQCSTCRIFSKICESMLANKDINQQLLKQISSNIAGNSRCGLMQTMIDTANAYMYAMEKL